MSRVAAAPPAAAAACAKTGGGASAAGNAAPTLCDGAPVYQNAAEYVLLRVSEGGGGTRWYVSRAESLADCDGYAHWGRDRGAPRSDLKPGRLGYAPTAPAYGQWSTPANHDSISVVAGGGR